MFELTRRFGGQRPRNVPQAFERERRLIRQASYLVVNSLVVGRRRHHFARRDLLERLARKVKRLAVTDRHGSAIYCLSTKPGLPRLLGFPFPKLTLSMIPRPGSRQGGASRLFCIPWISSCLPRSSRATAWVPSLRGGEANSGPMKRSWTFATSKKWGCGITSA